MTHEYEIPDTYECPEKEAFLHDEEISRGHGYYPTKSDCIRNFKRRNCNGSCNQKFLDQTTLYLFDSIAKEHGFLKFEKIKEETINGKLISKTETIIGLYKDEDNYTAFIHGIANKELLPSKFRGQLKSLHKVENVYEGQNYIFLSFAGKIYSFNANFYRNIKDAISKINSEHSFEIREHQISADGELMGILMDDNSIFIIAVVFGYKEYIEEERVILVQQLEAARPFFSFEPYKKVDWSKLKKPVGSAFESLCEKILNRQDNLVDVQSIGKTNASDRGRDFIVYEKTPSIDGKIHKVKWLVQCKFSESSISTKTVPDWVTRSFEHEVDGYWLITNNDLTPDLIDQLNDSSKNSKLKIQTRFWQRLKFDALFHTHPDLFTKDDFE